MSQQQPRRPTQSPVHKQEPIKYGDVFAVSGELASKPIAPQDAAMMQSAENLVLGQTQKGGPAAVMQSAANQNERAGVVGHGQVTGIASDQGMSVSETDLPGGRIVSESVGGQVIGHYVQPGMTVQGMMVTPQQGYGGVGGGETGSGGGEVGDGEKITIGEALEATALTAGDKPVDQTDAAAIQAAEVRATGCNVIRETIGNSLTPGGVAAAAQASTTSNARVMRDEDKTKLGDVLSDATVKLPSDKAVTRRDEEGVVGAEMRNNPELGTHPGGVAASLVAAARINQKKE